MTERLGDIENKLRFTPHQERPPFSLCFHQPNNIEIRAVFHPLKECASLGSVVRHDYSHRQMTWIRIDNVSEQEHLHNWQREDDGKSHSIPAHLNKLLADHPGQPGRRKQPMKFHAFSFELSIRWMNASSRPERTFAHS